MPSVYRPMVHCDVAILLHSSLVCQEKGCFKQTLQCQVTLYLDQISIFTSPSDLQLLGLEVLLVLYLLQVMFNLRYFFINQAFFLTIVIFITF